MVRQFMTLVAVSALCGFVLGQTASAQEPLPKKCRTLGASYDLETASLPVCTTSKRATRPAQQAGLPAQSLRGPASASAPEGTSTGTTVDTATPSQLAAPTRRLTFESYMNSNANHPAFARARVLPQEAFKDWSKPAVISGSTLDPEAETRAPASGSSGVAPSSSSSLPAPAAAPGPGPGNR